MFFVIFVLWVFALVHFQSIDYIGLIVRGPRRPGIFPARNLYRIGMTIDYMTIGIGIWALDQEIEIFLLGL